MLPDLYEVPWDKGFYLVPGFTKYRMNREGVLKNNSQGKVISWVIHKPAEGKNITGGYYVTNIHSDEGVRKGVSRHRLLALMFIPCPGNPDDYTVNHKDGIPGNDFIPNLEWMTYGENNKHAYDNGLKPNAARPIILRYWKTGEELTFNTIALCVEHLKIPYETVRQRLGRNNGVAYEDGTQLKFADTGEWISPKLKIAHNRPTRGCYAKHAVSGTVVFAVSARQMALCIGGNADVISKILREESEELYRDFKLSTQPFNSPLSE